MSKTITSTPIELPATTTLNPSPRIVLYFSGLILMAYNSVSKRIEAGVHSTSPNHRFRIIVKTISRTGTTIFEPVATITPIEFSVEPAGAPSPQSRVLFYQNDPFDRDSFSDRFFGNDDFGAVSIDDLRDFRWIIDFESRDLHNRPLEIDQDALTPRIHINDGIFYTARRTLRTFNRIKVRGEDDIEKVHFGGVAHVIGANVHYQAGQQAKLKLSTGLTLTFEYEQGTNYKIAFINDPIEDDPAHNDFKEYYRVITDVPEPDQFDLCPFDDDNDCQPLVEPIPSGKDNQLAVKSGQLNVKSTAGDYEGGDPPSGGSDKVPCAAGFLGQSNGLPSGQ